MRNEILPVLNTELLQQKANEYAQKGAEETLKEFYSGYNSPYKKAIEENLKNKGLDNQINLPDIIAELNEKLSTEIDLMANTAIAKTFIPLVKSILTRESGVIKFSDILKEFIEYSDFDRDEDNYSEYSVERNSYSKSLADSFPVYLISNRKETFELRFYVDSKELTTLMSLPYLIDERGHSIRHSTMQKMTVSVGDAKLELPFTKGVLENRFVSYIARLVIGSNHIEFDITDFDEDLFPQRDNCHC